MTTESSIFRLESLFDCISGRSLAYCLNLSAELVPSARKASSKDSIRRCFSWKNSKSVDELDGMIV